MPPAPPRPLRARIADARVMLATPAIDVWVATASAAGAPHLVPVSLAWVGERAVIAVQARSVTARNLLTSGTARLGVGPTRDVVMIDAELDRSGTATDDPALAAAYAAQADWDPRDGDDYLYLVLRPVRMQAWREANEIEGRTLMRGGRWLDPTEETMDA